ncbi:MAG: hypothetical protein JST38_19885 [Bacteroidetes bacterium]|nr:hypothetical protein [Bacteroidota bacterium]
MDQSNGRYQRTFRPRQGARQQPGVEAGAEWPTTAMALGILVLIVCFWSLGQRTLITYSALFRWLALFAVAGNLLPRKWYAKRFAMDHLEWFWFNLLAVGPAIFCCCLLLNFLVHGPEERMLVQAGRNFDLHAYWLREQSFPEHLPWPGDWGKDPDRDRLALSTAGPDDKVYALAQGCFGYVVITRVDEVHDLLPDGR